VQAATNAKNGTTIRLMDLAVIVFARRPDSQLTTLYSDFARWRFCPYQPAQNGEGNGWSEALFYLSRALKSARKRANFPAPQLWRGCEFFGPGEGSIPVPLPPPARFGAPYFPGANSPKSRRFCRCFCSGESRGRLQSLSIGVGECIFLRNLRTRSGSLVLNLPDSKGRRADSFRIHLPQPRRSELQTPTSMATWNLPGRSKPNVTGSSKEASHQGTLAPKRCASSSSCTVSAPSLPQC
jgi:hypothetical protein